MFHFHSLIIWVQENAEGKQQGYSVVPPRVGLLPPCGVLVNRKNRVLLYYMDSGSSAQWVPCFMTLTQGSHMLAESLPTSSVCIFCNGHEKAVL